MKPEIYKDEGYKLMGAAFEVYNDRGYGMAEETSSTSTITVSFSGKPSRGYRGFTRIPEMERKTSGIRYPSSRPALGKFSRH